LSKITVKPLRFELFYFLKIMKKICIFLCFLCLNAWAQKKKNPVTSLPVSAPKKVLTHEVYDSWKEIAERQISSDGQTAIFCINPQEGDGRLVFRGLTDARTDSVKRGYEAQLSDDAGFAVFKIKVPVATLREAKKAKKKKEEMPKDSLGIWDLKKKTLLKYPNLVSVKMSEKNQSHVAFLSTKPKDDKNKKAKPDSEENGYTLTVRALASGQERKYPFVKEYNFSKNGNTLIFSASGLDSTLAEGVYVLDLTAAGMTPIFTQKSKIKKLTLSADGSQAALIADLDTNAKTLLRQPTLFHWTKGQPQAQALVKSQANALPQALGVVNEHTEPRFSKDGQRLYFMRNDAPAQADTSLLPEELVQVEVWNWTDKRLQTQQKVTLEQDKKRGYWTAVQLATGQVTPLADPKVPLVFWDKDLEHAQVLAVSNEPYSQLHWDWNNPKDIYLLSLADGQRRQVAANVRGDNPVLSGSGQWASWWSSADTAWFVLDVQQQKVLQVTDNKKVKFFDEEDDHPNYPSPYGVAGWLNDTDQPTLVVYDRYDAWAVNVRTLERRNLTNGRANREVMRYLRLDVEEKKMTSTLWKMVNEKTRAQAYVSLQNEQRQPLLQADMNLSAPIKAKNADRVIFSKSNFQTFPDLHTSDLTFAQSQAISQANPQQSQYAWGSVSVVSWRANDGTPLEGLLYKPEHFDPAKQYPMLVYFYERESENLHNYVAPSPIRASINYSYFTSNGYLVFVPDIVYKTGYPGQSAYNCILPGVMSLLDKGFVQRDRIGIQGHSWGGYQTAYLVTQTNLFRCAESGAPVSNMTSAYGAIRWESGLARQAQYEISQSRIGGTLWEKPLQFLENSPLFHLPKVQTPLLILHNDDDGAVPWYQGIELYLGLKRLDKPVWMINYNGEKHGLTQRKNRKDWAKKMYGFFDHYLKDAPAPTWMTEGQPMLQKGMGK
jgi:dipeptidyl aminopeptidase/acylaminoacyl peptidase